MFKSLLSSIVLVFSLGLLTSLQAQAPANDSCANAIVVMTDEVVSFSTVEATTDTVTHANDCVSSGTTPDSVYQDIWYTWTADFTGLAQWSLCGVTNFDTKIFVYGPGASCLPSDDDIWACNEDGGDLCGTVSEVIFDVNEGETFLLRIGGFGDGSPGESGTGEFTIVEFIPSVPNDLCEDAIEIGLVEGYEFSTSEASTDGPDHPDNSTCFGFGSATAGSDIWFTYTADFDGFVNWTTCDLINFDSRLVVYGPNVTCPVTPDDLYACNDDGPGCTGYNSDLTFSVQSGNTYLLRLGGYAGDAGTGTFDLVEIIPPDPPANNLCENANDEVYIITTQQADDLDVVFEGTTSNGTFEIDSFQFPVCLDNDSGEFSDVWYSFNNLGNTELEIRFNIVTPDAEFYVDLWNSCGEIVDTNIIQNSCQSIVTDAPFVVDTITGLPADPTDYLLRVTTHVTYDPPGDFWFQLVGAITTDVEEPQFESFTFFPNPVTDQATSQFALLESGRVRTTVYNPLGQLVSQEDHGNLPQGKHNIQTSVEHLPPGIYLFNLQVNDYQESVKFIKK